MQNSCLPPLRIKGKSLLPIVQGGMGVGIWPTGWPAMSRARAPWAPLPASTFASTILISWSGRAEVGQGGDQQVNLDRAGPGNSGGSRDCRGAWVGCRQRDASGHRIRRVRPAGMRERRRGHRHGGRLPLDLPNLTADFPDVALVPILSDVRGINVVLKKWARKNRLPDAIVIEHPLFAGGHLGATKLEGSGRAPLRFRGRDSRRLELLQSLGIEAGRVPLIAAGESTVTRSSGTCSSSGRQRGNWARRSP